MRHRGNPRPEIRMMAEPPPAPSRMAAIAMLLLAWLRSLHAAWQQRPARPVPTREQLILGRVDDRERTAIILLTVASAGTVMLTYFGVSGPMTEQGAGILQKGEALAFSVTIGILSFLGWSFAFGLLPLLTGRRLATGAAGAVIYVLGIAAVDAPYNVVALGGDRAVQLSLLDTARSYERLARESVERTLVAQKLVPALRTQEARFQSLKDTEIETGANSGRSGAGRVSEGYSQITMLAKGLADQLERGREAAEAIQTALTADLAAMKDAAFTQGPLRMRAQAVSAAADRMDAQLAGLGQHEASASIRATITSLGQLFVAPGDGVSDFERTQNTELVRIAAMARQVADSLSAGLAALPVPAEAAGEPQRPLDPMTAVKRYWRELLPQWAAAIFANFAPAILLLILLAGRREAAAGPPSPAATSKETVS